MSYDIPYAKCMDVARTIRELRRERGLTQMELAWRSGLSVTTISRLETGKAKLTPKVARALAVGLGMDYEELRKRLGEVVR